MDHGPHLIENYVWKDTRKRERERQPPIKDEQKTETPALFNSRKNQIIRPHKNGKANAGSLTILRILQTKDNNIMSAKGKATGFNYVR